MTSPTLTYATAQHHHPLGRDPPDLLARLGAQRIIELAAVV
ncbi:hypothetical protein [Nocardia mangyaensis]|nr:hypothetical protein [Nocardia mangyaensis]